ncbi:MULTISPECIES: response regulator transcription factor [unclassified Bradyrhizobium]|uniref:LuxR C-terminal-related transcriptional regulator n=1 Tax=unclassified Bradyrhizobium TaxID=2631580 RepID=UPI002479EF57|nr:MULTISPECIES: response regulator transcription factor [unclassified Bradyrhizobium]WGR69674.1 response regulator transcription factor [Bradyrhizobium sp. ISRA426]WGR81731.1 response regulator transcription factor [Bradyrhizobium sp. ISRA430]WGR84916.1 response regulator transcription factor [Bradyrhizobium sp. ISRA432]
MSAILVVDEHSVYRSGLRDVIESRFKKSRVLDASRLEGFDLAISFDLILIDHGCLTQRSLGVLAELFDIRPTTRIAVMSTSNTRADVLRCLSAGFHGFVPKLQSDEELLSAIGDLLSGRIYVPRWLADDDVGQPEPIQSVNFDLEALRLTRRQNEILPLLAQGMSNKEIARELNIAEGTSKIHTAALLRALGARNRTEAAFMAAKLVGSKDRLATRIKSKRFVIDGPNGAQGLSHLSSPRWSNHSLDDLRSDRRLLK